MGALLFASAHLLLHPVAAKVAIVSVKVASCIGIGMLFDHVVMHE